MRVRSLTVVVLLMVGMAACSGSGSDAASGNASAPPASNAVSNGSSEVAGGANAAANGASQGNAVDRLNRKRRHPVNGSAGADAPLDFRPGPENSDIATTMNAEGQPVEVRVFKDHPQLTRVEAVWLGPSEKLVTITLRDGTTVEVKTDRIPSLNSAPSELLVALAGGSK